MADDDNIVIEDGGVLRLPPRILREMRASVGTRMRPVAAGESLLLVFREHEGDVDFNKWVDQCTLIGQVGAFGIADLFSTINMSQKTGVVVFESGHVQKRVYFENGEIVFSVSNESEFRLGEILVNRGMISRKQIDEILSSKEAGVRLGARLIQKGYLRAKDLYEAVRYQVEEIIFSVFPMSDGNFYFFEGDYLDEDLSQFTLNTQNILMEGYRRMDEWGLMREKIPHEGVVVLHAGKGEVKFDTPVMETVFHLIDGKKSVKELIRASGKGEFDVNRALYDLLRKNAIETIDPKATGQDKAKSLEGMIDAYNKLYVIVGQALDRAGRSEALGPEQMAEFVKGLDDRARQVLDGVNFDPTQGVAGSVSVMLSNLESAVASSGRGGSGMSRIAGLSDLFKRQQLQGALDEVLNYFLFTLKNALPADQADTFIQKVRTAHKRLRDAK